MIEIERKFLVKNEDYKIEASNQTRIIQGYLNSDPNRTVRIRVRGDKGYLTIKGISNASGTSRFEWEKEIKIAEANQLIALCEEGVIDKIRYEVRVDNHTYEVDEFFGNNEGLTVAEVELTNEKEIFRKPSWLAEEVTGDKKYYNSALSKQPFQSW